MAEDTTTRGRQLQQLAQSLPGANQKIQQGLGEARKTQLQETVRQLQPQQATTQVQQQLGAQQAQAAGQAQLQGMQQQQNQAVQLGQMGLQERGREERQKAAEAKLSLSEQQMLIGNKLSKIDRDLRRKLLDDQLEFRREEGGRTLFNERQLMDWAVINAKSDEEFKNYQMAAQQVQTRKLQLMEQVHRVSRQALEQGYIVKNKPLDQASQTLIAQVMNGSATAAAKARASAANTMAKWQAGGTAVGAGIGAAIGTIFPVVGTAVGAVVGGVVGKALGTIGATIFG